MKKLFSKLMLPILALGMLVGCDDVPSPYYILMPEEENYEFTGEGNHKEPYTVNDALFLINNGTYSSRKVYVKGIVVQIDPVDDSFSRYHNLTYYIASEDDIEEDGSVKQRLEVYRGLGLAGKDFGSPDDLKVGDEVIVWGQLTLYNNTPEITQGSWLCALNGQDAGPFESEEEPNGEGTYDSPYNVARAQEMISTGNFSDKPVFVHGIVSRVDEPKEDEFARYHNLTYYISDDGTSTGQLEVYRGMGLSGNGFENPDDLKPGDEVTIYGTLTLFNSTPEITQGSFLVQLNDQKVADPSAASEAKGSGTLEDPYNPAAANEVAEKLSAGGKSENVYVKGIVSSIKENYDSGFGNGTFYISEDGSTVSQFYVFQANYLGNTKWTQNSGDVLKVGDEVVIYGKLMKYTSNYGTTLETAKGEAYLYSLNGKTVEPVPEPEPSGSGTLNHPYNSVAANNFASKLSSTEKSDDVYVKGKVVSIKENYQKNSQFGNATFYISDDGTPAGQFYCFRVLYLGNEKYVDGDVLKVGDDVVICGKLVNYQGNTPETSQNEAYLYSLNGKTSVNNGPSAGTGEGTYASPYDVTAALSLYADGKTPKAGYVKGYVVGYCNSRSLTANTAVFGGITPNDNMPNNILIADSQDETDYTKCVAVQLPTDEFKRALAPFVDATVNLSAYKRQVTLYGTIDKAFQVCGVTNLSYAEINYDTQVQTVGTKPEVKKRKNRR